MAYSKCPQCFLESYLGPSPSIFIHLATATTTYFRNITTYQRTLYNC